jgi:hypothetical protein
MRPNFEEMTSAELRAYALAHRDDIEPLRVLYSRRSPDSEATWYGPMSTPEGVPIEENIRIAEEAIRKRAEVDRENDQYTHQTMTTVTPEEIAKFRAELADYPEALEALDVIEECDYNLEDAAEVLADTEAVRKGGSKKPDVNLLDELAEQLRDVICKDEFRNGMLNDSVNVAVGVLLASSTVNPAVLVIPAFMYVMRKGINKFCDTPKIQ